MLTAEIEEPHGIGAEKETFLRIRPDWNRMGPPVPLWFRKRVEKLGFTLQFIPPRSIYHPRGVNPDMYPGGVWDICKRLRRSKFLHPRVVFSLADSGGNYVRPCMETWRILRYALYLQRMNRMEELEDMMDRSIADYQQAIAGGERERFHNCMQKFCSLHMGRQWQNRVRIRDVEKSKGSKVESLN
jgi:hypothetical protein